MVKQLLPTSFLFSSYFRQRHAIGPVLKTLCFLLLNLLWATQLQAQTVTIPAGNTDNTADVDPFSRITDNPLGNYFGYERSAIIYTAAEIGTSGNITAISFYLNATNTPAASTPLQIYLKQTSASAFTSSTLVSAEETGATLVFNRNVTASELTPNSWVTLTFTSPFTYSNASNLEVIVETNGGDINGGMGVDPDPNSKTFRFSSTGSVNQFQYWQQDGSAPNFPGNLLDYRPNTQLVFGAQPQPCNAPTNLAYSNVTSTSASISFTANATGAPGTYVLEYGASGFTPGTGTVVNNISNPYDLTGLSPSTAYQFYIRKNCGADGTSPNAGPVSFTTAAPLTCDAPTNLNATNVTSTSAQLNFSPSTTGASGSYTLEYGPSGFTRGSGTSVSGLNASPYNATNLTPGTNYQFYVTKNCGSNSTSSTAGPAAFTTAAAPTCNAPTAVSATNVTTTSAQINFSGGGTGTSYTLEYGPSTTFPSGTTTTGMSGSPFTLSNLNPGTSYSFVIRTNCSNGLTSANSPTGNFTTTTAPTCNAPTNLTASNVTGTSASIGFSASTTGATGTYILEYGASGFTPGTGTVVNNISNPYTLSGLTPSISYQFYIRKDCGTTGFSANSGPGSFTTAAAPLACNAPTNLNASNITTTSASLNFTPGSGGASGTYTLEYGPNGFSRGNGTVVANLTGSPYNVSNLSPGTAYQFYVTKNCGSNGNSTTAGPAAFSTTAAPQTCNAPTNLTASSVTATSASIGFSASTSGATGTYVLEYGPSGFSVGNGTVVNNISNPFNLTGLTPSTAYQFYIRKNCDTTGVSANAGPGSFTTGAAPLTCDAPTNLNATNVSSTSASLNFSPSTSGASGTYTLEYGPSGFSRGNGTVITGLTSSPYNVTSLTPNTAYQFYVTKDCGGSLTSTTAGPASFNTQPAPSSCVAGTWLGTTSSNWHTAANWCNGQIPTSSTDVIIPSGTTFAPVISSNAFADDININAAATLTISAGTLTVGGQYTEGGRLINTGTGSLAFTGTNLQQVGKAGNTVTFLNLSSGPGGITLGGPVGVRRLLTLNGNLVTNGNTFTLMSDPSLQAMVINAPGIVVGTATVQRYINPGVNQGLGYRHLTSPVANATIAQLNDPGVNLVVNPAYNTNPNPGTTRPFPTIFRYNQGRLSGAKSDFTYGWESPNSLSDPMTPGRGFTVNMLPVQVTISGVLNNGIVTTGPLTRGSTANSGWHLVGNPYPSPINWDKVTVPSGLDKAVYVYRSNGQYSGFYASYVNGIGVPGTNLIPTMQAFFVRVTSGAPTLTFTNAARVTDYESPALYRKANTDTRPQAVLSLGTTGGQRDNLYIYFENGATAGFDSRYDAAKIPNPGNIPTFFSLAGTEMLAINGLPGLNAATSVPLGAWVSQAGTYTLQAEQFLNFPANQQVYLEDRLTGTRTNLRQQNTYTFTTTQTDLAGRFYLHFGGSGVSGLASAKDGMNLVVYPNPNRGQFTLSMALPDTKPVDAMLFNAVGQQVWQKKINPGATHLLENIIINILPRGMYTLQVKTSAGIIQQKVIIE
ncbi:fibronectin type III domain-containing protein [Adhaeribacter soli]|uniref:T9SS type A sorting domain-containing protein n=1 Tax=Adhaeribacter soli TaxID=2607655 RepID=A0A5N1IN17_9BACT|nr:fibronectin type III domain-containing protein [Adhaeribacter soli]KAA9331247.1 T9SS type A sorting domain-containing protein [Adhaeribacter soli]